MSFQDKNIEIKLPGWINSLIGKNDIYLPSIEDRMSFVIKASQLNVSNGTGGPFAAAIFESESGKLVSLGINMVTSAGLSVLHAEIVAFMLAQKKIGGYDLGGFGLPAHELVASTEPCAMCLGATVWSGVRRVITGAGEHDARKIGFDEGPKSKEWKTELEKRGISVISGVKREEAQKVLLDYSLHGGIIYNSREAG